MLGTGETEGSGTSGDATAQWQQSPGGFSIEVRAVPVSMRVLVLSICGVVTVLATTMVAALIALDTSTDVTVDLINDRGRMRLVYLVPIVTAGLVATTLLFLAFRRAARRFVVRIDEAGLRIDGEGVDVEAAWRDIERVDIRVQTDYARIAVRRHHERPVTLLAGILRWPRSDIADLPDGLRRLLDDQEFTRIPTRSRPPGELYRFVQRMGS